MATIPVAPMNPQYSGKKDFEDLPEEEKQAQAQQSAQQQPAQKPIATEAECQQALVDIKNAQSKADLANPYNYFKGTQFAQQINNACKAKIDQMGWTS